MSLTSYNLSGIWAYDPVVPLKAIALSWIKATLKGQVYLPQEFTSTGRAGTLGSARRILGQSRLGCLLLGTSCQNVVRQFGPYPSWVRKFEEDLLLGNETRGTWPLVQYSCLAKGIKQKQEGINAKVM